MQQFEPQSQNKVASTKSVSDLTQGLSEVASKATVETRMGQISNESPSKWRAMQLMSQPIVAWVCLIATAKATGQFELSYKYSAQTQILLSVVPLLILLFVGLRLRNPRLAFVTGCIFATITVLVSMSAGFGATEFVAAATMPFLAAGTAAISHRPDVIKRFMPAIIAWLTALTGFIVATASVQTATPVVTVANAPMTITPPAGLAPITFRTENTTTLSIGALSYNCKMLVESLSAGSGIFPAVRTYEQGMILKSPDGTSEVSLDKDGILQWKNGKQVVDVVDASTEPISAVSMNADGNMVVFKQAGLYMIFTPSKGARGLEEVLNQFSGSEFQGDSQLGMILPEDVQGATWRPDGKQLSGSLYSGTFGNARFEFDMEKK